MILRICRQKKARKRKECVALRGTEAMSDYSPVFCLILPTPWARAGPENNDECIWACTLSFYKLKQNRFELDYGLPRWHSVKDLPAMWVTQVQTWVGKTPWRREWQLTPVFLSGEFHGQRSLADYIAHGATKSQTRLSD